MRLMTRLLEVLEVVDEDLVLERDHDLVPPQPHPKNLAVKPKLSYPLALVVVPNEHLFCRKGGKVPAPNDREEVAAEEHLDNADAAEGAKPSRLVGRPL